MTDKELENVIYCCGIELDCKDCPFYDFVEHSLCIEHKRNAAKDYIDRLKAENERLKQSDTSKENCTIEQHAEIHKLRDELKQIRKETAKEILQELYETKTRLISGASDEFIYACNIITFAKKYGVEVD